MKYTFDPFTLEYEKVVGPIYDFQTECAIAAKKAASLNTKNKPLMVMMSGGMDSEIIGEGFYKAGIPFRVLIGKLVVKMATGTVVLNEHDFVYAQNWCRDRNIDVVYTELDVFKNAELLSRYAFDSLGFSPQYAWHMYLMKWCHDNGCFFVAGLGDIDIVLHNGEYCCADTQREWSIDNFCTAHGVEGVIRFVKLDSRLVASYLRLSSVQRLMEQGVENVVDHKFEVFSEAFPHIPNRNKYTGFEKIQGWDNILRAPMKEIHGKYNTISYLPISYFKEQNAS